MLNNAQTQSQYRRHRRRGRLIGSQTHLGRPGICRHYRYQPIDLFGKTFESITHADDLDLDDHLCERLFAGEISTYEMEKRYIHRDGTIVPIHLGVKLVHDRSGSILYAISTVEKIADRAIYRVRASDPLTPRELELDRIRRAVLG